MRIVEFPPIVTREAVAAALMIGCVTILFFLSPSPRNISAHSLGSKIIANQDESAMPRAIPSSRQVSLCPIS